MIVVCYLILYDYPSFVDGESHGILYYFDRAYHYAHLKKIGLYDELYDENNSRDTHLKFTFMMTQRFGKRHNKPTNLWEIGLFQSFRCTCIKVTDIIIVDLVKIMR